MGMVAAPASGTYTGGTWTPIPKLLVAATMMEAHFCTHWKLQLVFRISWAFKNLISIPLATWEIKEMGDVILSSPVTSMI